MSHVQTIEEVLGGVKAVLEDNCEIKEQDAIDLSAAIMHMFILSPMTHDDYKIAYKALLDGIGIGNSKQPEITEEDVKEGDDVLLHDDLP